ncbi:hypothetical protein BDR04DRAFT_1095482, partial [Suillus decipiens]
WCGFSFLVFWLACLILNEEVRSFDVGGALVTAHFHTVQVTFRHHTVRDVIFPGEQLNQTFLIALSDGACFHITHVSCGTHSLSCRKLKWKPYIVVVRGRERGEQ